MGDISGREIRQARYPVSLFSMLSSDKIINNFFILNMGIRPANSNDVEYISQKLSTYFEEANSHFGFEKYKTDIDLMLQVVSKRISELDSEYRYLVALDEDELIGFVNFLVSEKNPEILVVIGESLEIKKSLIEEAINILKEMGYTFVYGEVGGWEDTKDLVKEYDGEVVQIRYKLKV